MKSIPFTSRMMMYVAGVAALAAQVLYDRRERKLNEKHARQAPKQYNTNYGPEGWDSHDR